ncbi:hypothetical protein [Spiroplasma endosymbiont of 'Nebria riversi']|nr:hypothetical protein [Spiroplasma endosymbiont of 'Nebria riversi']
MKKLLSLLSTITTARSGIAEIVANSPYPTQEQHGMATIFWTLFM